MSDCSEKIQENKKLKTEDLGKIFEMGICIAYKTPYDGNYKYSMDKASTLGGRLKKLIDLYPNMKHVASGGSQDDFRNDQTALSAKTNKKRGNKVAPQVIGQASPKKFCDLIKIEFISKEILKQYIQENITIILPVLVNYTFHCPVIYYNESFDYIKLIILKEDIEWSKYEYKWTKNYNNWNSSSTLKIIVNSKEYSLLEVQFHSKRTNMAIRWNFINLIDIFNHNLDIKLID